VRAFLDTGAGIGRVAIPLARHGCRIFALELAPGILTELRAKAGGSGVVAVSVEGGRLPFPTGHFGPVVIVRLLYLTI
jgi:SAM-dependent methyltransferase